MSPGPVPGSGQDGEQPPLPASGDDVSRGAAVGRAADPGQELEEGQELEDEPDWDAAADLVVPAVWFSLAGTSDPAEVDLAGLAQGGPLNTRALRQVPRPVADMACDPQVLKALSDNQILGLAAAGRRLTAHSGRTHTTYPTKYTI